MAIAGFGLLFLGADILQAGMRETGGFIQLAGYSYHSWHDRFILTGLGFLLTFLLQSSTVAIVTPLAALGSGTVTMSRPPPGCGLNTGKVFYGLLDYRHLSRVTFSTCAYFFNLTTVLFFCFR